MRAEGEETMNEPLGGLSASADQMIQNEILITVKSQLNISVSNKTSFSVITKPEVKFKENGRENNVTNIPMDMSEGVYSQMAENGSPKTDQNRREIIRETSVDSTRMMNDHKRVNSRPIVSSENSKHPFGLLHQSWPLHQQELLRQKRKLTVIFFVMVAIFFFSYIPHLSMKIFKYSRPDLYTTMSRNGLIAYNTIIWVLFVHYAANPLVLIFLDRKFRVEVMSFYKKLICCK